MKKINTSEKIIFSFLTLVFIFTMLLVIFNRNDEKVEEKDNYNVFALKDENRFFTISSAVDNYVSSVKYENVDVLMAILDKKYVQNNAIDKNNVFDMVENYSEDYAADVRRVYQVKKFENIYVYYVRAKLVKEAYDSFLTKHVKEVFYQVTINENTLAYSIAPIDQNEYLDKVGDLDE